MPRVSIIMALYNHERFVAQAIESVLAQTFADWELIVWDDGSKDGGLALARAFAQREPRRIRVFTHEGGANRGQENTRNAALEKAQGALLGLLDSDDYYLPRKLEVLVPRFADHRVGLAYGRARVESDPGGVARPLAIRGEPSGRVFDALAFDNFICAGATLFRRECLGQGARFDAEFRTIGEYPLWLRIARDWELSFVDTDVAVWRNHGENLGTRLAIKAKAELLRLNERLLSDADYAEHRNVLLRARAKRRYDYAAELYSAGRLRTARQLFWALAGDPAASGSQRGKSAVLATATWLGPGLNRQLSSAKRAFWRLRSR